jgi:hypothetical protein
LGGVLGQRVSSRCDAIVIRFRPTDPETVLKRAEQDTINRLFAASELSGIKEADSGGCSTLREYSPARQSRDRSHVRLPRTLFGRFIFSTKSLRQARHVISISGRQGMIAV